MTEHEAWHLFTDDMDICGCGQPHEAVRLVHDILKLCPLHSNRKDFEILLPNNGVQHVILSTLTHVNLIEHGGGIGGSWATSKGEELLKVLAHIGEDGWEKMFDNEREWKLMEGCAKCQPTTLTSPGG